MIVECDNFLFVLLWILYPPLKSYGAVFFKLSENAIQKLAPLEIVLTFGVPSSWIFAVNWSRLLASMIQL